jgi:hypothetical protein
VLVTFAMHPNLRITRTYLSRFVLLVSAQDWVFGANLINTAVVHFLPPAAAAITGCGKSTLMLALFRIVEPCGGALLIDGLDTATLGLADLRARWGAGGVYAGGVQGNRRAWSCPVGFSCTCTILCILVVLPVAAGPQSSPLRTQPQPCCPSNPQTPAPLCATPPTSHPVPSLHPPPPTPPCCCQVEPSASGPCCVQWQLQEQPGPLQPGSQ